VRAVVADQRRAGAPADLAAVRDEFRETPVRPRRRRRL
jgi:hypothetical protein